MKNKMNDNYNRVRQVANNNKNRIKNNSNKNSNNKITRIDRIQIIDSSN